MTIICAGNNEQFDFAKSIGIGLINSSINLTKLLLKSKPKSILFVGTAGSYGNLRPFEIIQSSVSTNIETGYFFDNCYIPIDNKIISLNDNVSCETTNKKEILVNSSNYITTNKEISNRFLKNGIEAENMEFFSILTVANKFNIPAFGIFIITNYCDEHAHKDFILNHKKAKQKLTTYVRKQVSNYE
ncbi:MAG: purine-nucleoside phosphorylase [Campylobacteraceae bacterium]|nr:purine-nucleoside phosphorylase [Campylobacteraceae bacterium]